MAQSNTAHNPSEGDDKRFAKNQSAHLGFGEAANAKHCDLANARKHRHDHSICNAEAAEQKSAATHGPGGRLQDFKLRVTSAKFLVFEGDEGRETAFESVL